MNNYYNGFNPFQQEQQQLKKKNHQLQSRVQLPSKTKEIVKAGSLLLTFKPFAFIVNSSLVHSHCDFCLQSSWSKDTQLLRCSSCHFVRYCDRECQKNGWGEGHKAECKGMKVYGKCPPSFARLLLRVIVKLQSKIDYCDQVTPLLFRRFKDLMSHYSDVKNDAVRMEHILTMGKVVESLLLLQKGNVMPNESELIGICGRIMVNSFSIVDGELQQVGTGIYLGASIFDHSCEPMAVATFDSTTISVRALVDYPPNFPIERATICYTDILRPSADRIAELKNIYYFECACIRCSTKVNDKEMNGIVCPSEGCDFEFCLNDLEEGKCPSCQNRVDEEFIANFKETEEMVRGKLSEMHSTAYLDVCQVCLNLMAKYNFAESHWLQASIVSAAFDASVTLQLWEKALFYGKQALVAYKRYLHPFHPFLGLALLKLAKLTWYMEKEASAKTYALEAKRILVLTHGSTSAFVLRELFPLLKEIASCSKTQS